MSIPLRTTTLVLLAAISCGQLIGPVRTTAQESNRSAEFPEPSFPVRATASRSGVVIEWRTGPEPILGFNVFRVRNEQRSQLNPGIIAGSVLIDGTRSQTYSWFDEAGTTDSEYYVESVDLHGETSVLGSAVPRWSTTLPAFDKSKLLASLGARQAGKTAQVNLADAENGSSKLQTAAGFAPAGGLDNQWSIAGQAALKIGVRADGWYRISQSQMAAAGFDTTGDARNLRLFVSGNEMAMRVSRDSGPLGAADFVEFWGQGLDTPTTDTQVYWLINGAQPGLRIATKGELTIGGNPIRQPDLPPRAATTGEPFYGFSLTGLMSEATTSIRQSREAQPPQIEEKHQDSPVFNTPGIAVAADKGKQSNKVETETSTAALRVPLAAPTSPSVPVPAAVPSAPKTEIERRAKPSKSSVRKTALRSSKNRRRRTRNQRPPRHNHAVAIPAPAPAFTCSLQHQERNTYYSAALNGERENFFGPVVTPGNNGGPVVTINLHNVETTATAPVQLQVSLQGVSFETHQVKVLVNGSLAGTISFVDETAITQTFPIPVSWLVEGDNAVQLAPVGSSHDTSVLDYLRLSYPHSFRADAGALQFSLKSEQSARVDGFTTFDLRALDITDPFAVQEVRPAVEASGGGFAATIAAGSRGKARRLVVLPASRLSQPAWLSLNRPSNLNQSTNAASLVIISYRDFIPALAALVSQRQAQGYSVAVVDIEDVFDEFSFGTHTPQAIKDFLSRAKTNWATAPGYLLLVGDASYDPRNYLGLGNFDFVPTKQVDTGIIGTATAIETASDDWLTDINGDGIADISTGRLPARTLNDANLMVSKIVNYAPANTSPSAMLVADTQGSYYFNFEQASDQVGAVLPATMTIQKVYRRLQVSDADARANIIAKFNSGQALTVYSGHGNVNIWGGQIFSANDALALSNGNRLPFVVVMDCLNGFFDDPSVLSLSEALLEAPNGGAVASFASSGLTIPDGQHQMGLQMFQLLYGGPSIPIGDASRQAKTATNDSDVRRTWILLGDPTLKIR